MATTAVRVTSPSAVAFAGAAPAAAPDPPDEVLVQRLRAGETAAGEVLVQRYYQPLMRYLQRLSGNDHVAEELHQQTWLSVLDHLDKFDPRGGGGGGGLTRGNGIGFGGGSATSAGAFKAWLFRIATNKANDLWRSRGREKTATEGLRLVMEQEAPWAGQRLEGNEQEQKLIRAIQQLPETQRQVLLLRYYSDLKFVEIADMLGCPLNTALGRMHKAMLKLKQMMEA
jgi:RNA polymerase sigma-70 factor (ECF subfamily)